MLRFQLGLAGVLHDSESEQPRGFCRDDILAHLVEQIANETMNDSYELRELLSSELPLSSDDGSQQGELLVMQRADNTGGPLARAEADRIVARVDAVGRGGMLHPGVLQPRTVIVPPFCVNGPLAFGDNHPLHGASKVSAVWVRDRLDKLAGDLDRLRALLEICLEEKLPIGVAQARH